MSNITFSDALGAAYSFCAGGLNKGYQCGQYVWGKGSEILNGQVEEFKKLDNLEKKKQFIEGKVHVVRIAVTVSLLASGVFALVGVVRTVNGRWGGIPLLLLDTFTIWGLFNTHKILENSKEIASNLATYMPDGVFGDKQIEEIKNKLSQGTVLFSPVLDHAAHKFLNKA